MSKEPEALVTSKQLCAALNLPSVWTVDSLRRKRKIPCVQMGYRTIRYKVSDVARALGRFEIKEAGAGR